MTMQSAMVNGIRLEYEARGAGEPLALIHCNLIADAFAPLMDQPALSGYRLIRYHRRGYVGSSRAEGPVSIADQAADLSGLLGHLGVRRAHIAGHSYGGLIALQLAADYPDMVGALMLMEPPLLGGQDYIGGPASQAISRRMPLLFQRYREGDREGAADGFLSPVFGPGYRELLEQVLPGSWTQATRDVDMLFTVESPALREWRFGAAEAQRITAPMLSLGGGESDPAFFEVEQLLREWFPQLETVRVPGVNHLLQLRWPRLVAEALAEFLARHPLS